MAIDTTHPDYDLMEPEWRRVRDVIAGQSAMHRAGERYLRRAPGMTAPDVWQSYVSSTPFLEATKRTLEGYVGLAFYQDPVVEAPADLADFLLDATGDGVPWLAFTKKIVAENASIGRIGVMVDFPPRDPAIRSRLDEERAKRRPYVRRYEAETIINWKKRRIGGVVKLAEVRLLEVEERAAADDEWATEEVTIIRVLQLQPNPVPEVGYRYVQRVFESDDVEIQSDKPDNESGRRRRNTARRTDVAAERKWKERAPVVPLLPNGRPLDYIPFWIINPEDQSPDMVSPPMLGMANANIAHFNTSGQLENTLFWAGNPQPYITGVDSGTDGTATGKMLIGSSEAWLIKEAQSKVDFLHLGPDATQALEKRLDRTEQHMAVLGARMLQVDKKQVEAAETARIHRQGEVSVLAGVCNSVSLALTDVLSTVRDWEGATGEVKTKLTTKFFDEILTPEGVVKLVDAWQKGAFGYEDLLENLKRGGIIDTARTAEMIASDLQTSPVQPVFPKLTGALDDEDEDKPSGAGAAK